MRKTCEMIKTYYIVKCLKCNGYGSLPFYNEAGEPLYVIEEKNICDSCNGTGGCKEKYYIIIDLKNNIAVDSDNIG